MGFTIHDLRCENMHRPLALATAHPVFSWKIHTPEENWYQKSYRLFVKDASGHTIWDSGVTESRETNYIVYAGEALRPLSAYRFHVVVTSESGDIQASGESRFETGPLTNADWKGSWIGEEDGPCHVYRKSFVLESRPVAARLYICGLGQEDCALNGRMLTDEVLSPGWPDYRKTLLYRAVSVTDQLQIGENALAVLLTDGMYNVQGGRYVYYKRTFGQRKLLANLVMTFADGHIETIATDRSWLMGPSPVTFCCLYGGEDRDGRIPFVEVSSPSAALSGFGPSAEVDFPSGKLTANEVPPLAVREELPPKAVRSIGEHLLVDFGVNFSGTIRLTLTVPEGCEGMKIRMVPGELLTPEGDVDTTMTRGGYSWNYITGPEHEQEFFPDMSYTGFRYLRIEGASLFGSESSLPAIEAIHGEFIYPKLEESGSFTCSDPLLNSIHAIVRQAMLSNLKNYITDCPHREKFPWLEQTHLIGPSMNDLFDLQNLYEKIEQDCIDSQHADGLIPDICPEYATGFDQWHKGFLDSPEWGSAVILNPWQQYIRYGNRRILETAWPTMVRYADYLWQKTWHGILHHGLGDWLDIGPCTPYSQNTPVPVCATAILAEDLNVLCRTAGILGKSSDQQRFEKRLQEVKTEFVLQFLDTETGRVANGSQACQAMALMNGLIPEKYQAKAVKQLRDEVVKRGYAITAGDVGHPYLTAALHRFGLDDVLFDMTKITETPGYGYQVINGATTLTEEWDGPSKDRPHGSQNHLMLGSIVEWFFAGLAGIEPIRSSHDHHTVRIQPFCPEGLQYVKASKELPSGKLSVFWERLDEKVQLTLTVPPNMTAEVLNRDGAVLARTGSGTTRLVLA